MKKHREAEARRALLEMALLDFQREQERRSTAPGRRTVEGLTLSDDQLSILVEGLEGTLEGENDPFRIKRPRGPAPLSAQEMIDAKTEVSRLMQSGTACNDAFRLVGEKFHRSEQAIRDLFYDQSVFDRSGALHRVWRKVLKDE